MDAKGIKGRLKREGYPHVYVWKDEPGAVDTLHSHDRDTKLVILEGSIRIKIAGVERTYKCGNVVKIPKGVKHSAVTGPDGCEYVVAEK